MLASVIDELPFSTVRITTEGPSGRGSGTGFFMQLAVNTDGSNQPVVVTNKHVIAGASTAYITILRSNVNDPSQPDYSKHFTATVALNNTRVIPHPDSAVDLVAIKVADVLLHVLNTGPRPFFRSVNISQTASPAFLTQLMAIEDVIMIGYPNGLWDTKNNLPIARRGITATPPFVDFSGNAEFMIDCACFPGSSGSPVFLVKPGSYVGKNGETVVSEARVMLLGVLYAGPVFNAKGDIQPSPIPTTTTGQVSVPLMMNLGYCIKAHKLFWFEEYFQAERRAAQATKT